MQDLRACLVNVFSVNKQKMIKKNFDLMVMILLVSF